MRSTHACASSAFIRRRRSSARKIPSSPRWPSRSSRAGATPRREIDDPQRFSVGDRVVAVGAETTGHTRLPRDVRGLTGVIDSCDGAFVFPDTSAAGAGENPQWTYTVRFEAEDVWGDVAEQRAPVYVGLWESYLEPAA